MQRGVALALAAGGGAGVTPKTRRKVEKQARLGMTATPPAFQSAGALKDSVVVLLHLKLFVSYGKRQKIKKIAFVGR